MKKARQTTHTDRLSHGLVVVVRVEFGEAGELGRKLFQSENGVGRADRNACAAIDAIVRIHIKLGRIREAAFILLGMDAIHRAGLHAQFIFRTGIRNYVCHMPVRVQFSCQL